MKPESLLLGVLKGEGSGPELMDTAMLVLDAVADETGLRFRREIGPLSVPCVNGNLTEETVEFCRHIFSQGGVILAGAYGGRFVYEMRRRFNLYYKLNPLRSYRELNRVCKIKLPEKPLDILIVRENLDGLYQGHSDESICENGREVQHTFSHKEKNVRAILEVAVQFARARRNILTVVTKDSGLPALHSLWRECALKAAAATELNLSFIDIDYAAYKLIQHPESFDVIVAPNCFGDILCDIGGVLAGSRGLTFGASFSPQGEAVYQTNHGAAHDLTNTGIANPVGQIFSLAMMLRESFGLATESSLIEASVRAVWKNGWRTADLIESGCRIANTRHFGELIANEIRRTGALARETCSAAG